MPERYNYYLKHGLLILLIGMVLLYMFSIVSFLSVNHIRGDEFLSYLHSHPNYTLAEVLTHIAAGADHSYTHSALLWLSFNVFGYTIVVQRALSLCCWALSAFLFMQVIKSSVLSSLWRYVITIATFFSNMGIFLATDGRFYSMLLLTALLQLWFIFTALKNNKPLNWLVLLVLQLLALFTSPLMVLFPCMLFSGLYIMYLRYREKLFLQQSIRLLLSAIITSLVYFSFFKVNDQLTHFTTKYSISSFALHLPPDPHFFELPFRWVLIPDFPFLSNTADGILFLILFVVLIVTGRKQLNSHFQFAPLLQKMMVVLALLLLAGFGIHFSLHLFFSIPAWPNRYYAFVFFAFPFAILVTGIYGISEKYRLFFFLLLSVLMLNRAYQEHEKVAERKQVLNKKELDLSGLLGNTCKAVCIEKFGGNYSEFANFGEWYIRFPELRPRLYYLYTIQDDERAAYFNTLKQMGYKEVLLISANEVHEHFQTSKPCYIITRPDDKRFSKTNYPNLIHTTVME